MSIKTPNDYRGIADCWVAKKGAQYICERNGELGKTSKASLAIAHDTSEALQEFIDAVTVDDRNARIIGNGYAMQELLTKGMKPLKA